MYRSLMLGLPGTGKTTFLAALWHVVEAADVGDSLRLHALHGDREHLNRIRDAWLECRALERTTVASEQVVTMKLVSPDGDGNIELVIPDMSGESFRSHLEHRLWPISFDEFVRDTTGLLLFIHPERVSEPVRIDQAEPLYAELDADQASPGDVDDVAGIPWRRELVPTQVQLIDLLQLVLERASGPFPKKLAVILSAWDIVSEFHLPPERWLAARLPMLSQYLRANPQQVDVRVYGLSAQGGDLERDIDRLAALDRPSERIIVLAQDVDIHHDVTAPIRWLMDGQRGGVT